MENQFVISGLKTKREELFRALRATEREIVRIKAQIEALDATAKLFSPDLALPPVKRGPAHLGRRTGITRAMLTALRDSPAPLSARQIAQAIAPAMKVDAGEPRELTKLVYRVRGALRRANGLAGEQRIDGTYWRVE